MTSTVLPLALAEVLAPSESARPVPGASRYWITDHGRLISLVNGVRVLQLLRQPEGYIHIDLWRDSDRNPAIPARWQAYVHELVALAFIGPRPTAPGVVYEIDHVDGDKANNALSNLRYVTRSQNIQLAIAAGRNPTTKLSSVAVWTLRCLALVHGDDAVVSQATQEYVVSARTVRDALAGRTWGIIPDPASQPSASELVQALFLDSDVEAQRLLRLSPFAPDSVNVDGPVSARILPCEHSADRQAA